MNNNVKKNDNVIMKRNDENEINENDEVIMIMKIMK